MGVNWVLDGIMWAQYLTAFSLLLHQMQTPSHSMAFFRVPSTITFNQCDNLKLEHIGVCLCCDVETCIQFRILSPMSLILPKRPTLLS
ncbi:hypothetical protein BDQ12DRAFT_690148 [Crucibulum laeve]|uniref:Secreted protein n=1 Tax=Crucibulum laeve TaxID=68775 RepID=A0A5C3LLU2_9AGAR|nr:hypothetical protein BDQ12DRAFT_690148 [Crucibulum laeve]